MPLPGGPAPAAAPVRPQVRGSYVGWPGVSAVSLAVLAGGGPHNPVSGATARPTVVSASAFDRSEVVGVPLCSLLMAPAGAPRRRTHVRVCP